MRFTFSLFTIVFLRPEYSTDAGVTIGSSGNHADDEPIELKHKTLGSFSCNKIADALGAMCAGKDGVNTPN